jgi:hypothetical protein
MRANIFQKGSAGFKATTTKTKTTIKMIMI